MLSAKMTWILCKRKFLAAEFSHSRYFFKGISKTSFNSRNLLHPHLNNLKVSELKPNTIVMNRISFVSQSFRSYNWKTRIIFNIKIKDSSRLFHKSECRYVHPIVWVVMKPVLKLFAVLSGRGFRKWWRDLPPNKKEYFIQVMKENRKKIGILALASVLLSVMYYISHLEETPITKRRRFIAFSPKQLRKINEFEFQQIMGKIQQQILPPHHPSTQRVRTVVNRILDANLDIKEVKQKEWGIAVINSSVENAFVLPIGYVFVFTGMLNLCSNDDQLGIILSHEIAHCLQNHGAENVSFAHLLDLVSIIIIATIWAILPSDSISLLTHWLFQKSTELFLQLPYNRRIEKEADDVGLQLAAKACFDVRESSAFWAKMALLNKSMGKEPQIEFLSTHPSHESRSDYLNTIMNEAIKLRAECDCPPLKKRDPRAEVEVVSKALEITRRKYLQEYPRPILTFPV